MPYFSHILFIESIQSGVAFVFISIAPTQSSINSGAFFQNLLFHLEK